MFADATRFGPFMLLATSGGLLLGALAFQYLGGLDPCALCIYQRYPHGGVIALAMPAAGLALAGRRGLVPWLTILAALAMLAGAAVAAFHAGVEFGWWKGLEACSVGSGTPGTLAGAFDKLNKGKVVSCSDVPWSLLGISMAGYNFLISVAVGLLGLWAAARMLRRPA